MGLSLDASTGGSIWAALLELRAFLLRPEAATADRVFFARGAGDWRFCPEPPPRSAPLRDLLIVPLSATAATDLPRRNGEQRSVFAFERFRQNEAPLQMLDGSAAADPALVAFRLYLPLLLGGHWARRAGRSFVLAHFAQTLDGRIACSNGSSRWIGSMADQQHAHRLRALHDVVLVGSKTVEADDPQLTVRHVPGTSPERVVVSASARILRARKRYRVFEGQGATVVCGARAARRLSARARQSATKRVLALDAPAGSLLEPARICAALRERGHHTVFVEGGAVTLSSFLLGNAIDVLQVHIAPRILGSGIGAFALPEVQAIADGRRFRMETFTLGGELLLECRAASPG